MSNCSEIIGVQSITLYKNSGIRIVRPDISIENEVNLFADGDRSGDFIINEPVMLPKWERIVNFSGNYKQNYIDEFTFLLHGINNDVPEEILSLRNNRLGYIVEILTTGNNKFIFPAPVFLNSENTKQVDSHSWQVSLSYRVPSFDDKLIKVIALVPEYRIIYESWTIKPHDKLAEFQSSMVSALVDAGIWAKLDVFYVLAAHTNTNGEALTNWFNPGTFDATAFNSPAFVILEGFTGSGNFFSENKYLDTNWKPVTNGLNFTQDDASFGTYIRTDVDESSIDVGARLTNDGYTLNTRNSNLLAVGINENGTTTVANTDSKGLYVSARTGAALSQIYKNKTLLASPNTVSTTLIDVRCFICVAAIVEPPPIPASTKQISMFFAGSSLNQTDVNNLTDAFEAYMDANGKGIIP